MSGKLLSRMESQTPGGKLGQDDGTSLLTIPGGTQMIFQIPTLRSKHRGGAQAIVLWQETQQWIQTWGNQEEGPPHPTRYKASEG